MLQYARSYAETGSGNYRFGFNGKEKNDEIEGAGNEYDYGMREQDPRTGRFWSVDPLTKNYAELTPYQFGGNSPIKNLDLDGGEPKDYSWNLQNRRFSVNGAKPSYYHIIDDSKLGIIDVEAVYDKITDKTWFIHQGNDGQNYYWKHNPGADQTVRTADNGQWKPYQTGEQAAAVQTEQLTRGISLGFALTIAAPFAVEAMTVTGGGPLWSASIPETFKIGAAKALIGGAGDLMAQKTVNGWDSKVNWYETGISAGASAFGLNPYTGAAALNFVQLDEKSNPVTPFNSNFDFKAYGLNVLLNGASGAAIGAAHLDPTAGLGLSNNAARTGGSTIFNYWGNTLGGVTTNAASAPSQSSANTTNNSSSKSDDKPE